MGINRKVQRLFPFFRKGVRVDIVGLGCTRSFDEILDEISTIFTPEIPNIFDIGSVQTIQNLRGKPETQHGAETGREILLELQGSIENSLSDEKMAFEATVESKFKEFKEGKIVYSLLSNITDGFEFLNLKRILSSKEVELTRIRIGLDYFESREFPFLRIQLQGLSERLYISIERQTDGSNLLVNGLIESKNSKISEDFSTKMRTKGEKLAQLTGITEIAREMIR